MILVDTSVWIDYFRGIKTPQATLLDSLLGVEAIATCDLVLTEVLQGFNSNKDFNQAKNLMASLEHVEISGEHMAIQAANNFRKLRSQGITVRKTVDTIIATGCIEYGLPLLFSDKDFKPFVEHLGLVSALGKK